MLKTTTRNELENHHSQSIEYYPEMQKALDLEIFHTPFLTSINHLLNLWIKLSFLELFVDEAILLCT